MAKADFKQRKFFLFGSLAVAISFILSGVASSTADMASQTVHAPCSDAPGGGLRLCTTYIPQLVTQVSKPGAAYPIPLPLPNVNTPPLGGLMQFYASAYYQGTDLDVSPVPITLPGNMYPGNNFGPICELVPNNLNHNKKETTNQDVSNNPAAPTCGKAMQIQTPTTNCVTPTDDETALLNSLNVTPDQLQNMNADQAQALLTQAAAAKPNVVSMAASNGKKICITLDASGKDLQGNLGAQNGSLERTYMRGTFLLALSYYTDQVLSQLQCQHALTVQGTSCQKFASQVAGLTGSTQNNMAALQSKLTGQVNIGDIDACNSQNPATVLNGTTNPGALRQSAQLLCSARSSLEAAFSNLVMCDIFSLAQNSYIANTGAPALQTALINQMNEDLDQLCRPGCKNSKSFQALQQCLQPCYEKNMPPYLTTKFQALWPQPTPAFAGACVGGP